MPDINDQINEKAVALTIKSINIEGELLAKAIKKLLEETDNLKKKIATPKDMTGQGKQTVSQLARQGQGVSNIEINSKNIKSFESVARKYGVDFALKKGNTEKPPVWLVFFKGRDADALTSAFKEFSAKETKRNAHKESVHTIMQSFSELVKNQVIDKVKNKMREGQEL